MRKHTAVKNYLRLLFVCLLILTTITGIRLIMWVSDTYVYADDTNSESSESGIVLNKTATYHSDTGMAAITLEAYVTGEKVIKTVTESNPTDIVLVLDRSGSMNKPLASHTEYNASTVYLTTNSTNYTNLNNKTYYVPYDGEYTAVKIQRTGTNGTYTYTLGNGITFTSTGSRGKPDYAAYGLTTNSYKNVQLYTQSTVVESDRLAALNSATDAFIKSVADASTDDCVHRIAIVGFGDTAETMWDLQDAREITFSDIDVESYSARTRIDLGINQAQSILSSINDETRNKVVVVLTDGAPNDYKDTGNTPTSIANSAIDAADSLKQDGVKVYAIGIFSGVDPSSSGTPYDDTMNDDTPDMINYFLQYLSTNNGTVQNPSYYLSASSFEALTDIFQGIASQIEFGGSSITLTEDTVVRDTISPYFTVPENTDGVTVRTADYIGNNEWGSQVSSAEATVSVDDKGVNVTGFDFSENWVGEVKETIGETTTTTYHGKKLIITFSVKVSSDYLGGSKTETNGPDSGIYFNNENLESFDIPTVDVPLKTIVPDTLMEGNEWNVYLTTENQLAEEFKNLKFTFDEHHLIFEDLFNGTNNAGVNVTFKLKDSSENALNTFTIPAGKNAGKWAVNMPTLSDSRYTVECTVTDAFNHQKSTTAEATIALNVFKPMLTFTDKNVYYGGSQVDLSAVTPTVEWKCGDTVDFSVTMNTDKPILTYVYSGVTGDTVDQISDYTVSVTKIGVQGCDDVNLLDIDNAITFFRSCGIEQMTQNSSQDETFKIHVYSPLLSFKDTSAYYGEKITLKDYSNDLIWTNRTSEPSSMDNEKPSVTVTTIAAADKINTDGYVVVTDDIPVKVLMMIGDTDVTQELIDAGKLTRTCETESNPVYVSKKAAYYVHVRTAALSVKKVIEGDFADKSKVFQFTVKITPSADTGLSEITEEFSLKNNEEKRLIALPKGAEFEIVENDRSTEKYDVYFAVNGGTPEYKDDCKMTGNLSSDETAVVVTNKRDKTPVTGINGDGSLLGYGIVIVSVIGFIAIRMVVKQKNKKYLQ